MSVITTPSDTDVVFHSGNRYANASHGTKMWSLLIAANKPLFCSLSKKDESTIAASIVSAVHNVGGTFLVKDKTSGMYYNVGTECAHDSTLFALGGTEPHYAESVEEISKVKRLFQAQCDYFTNTKQNNEEDLGNQVQSLVKMELDRLTNQAQHVEKTIIGNTSFTNATTKQQKEEEGQEGEKVAVAEDLENDNEQQQEEEVDAAVQVSALDALQQDNDQQANRIKRKPKRLTRWNRAAIRI